MWDSVCVFPVGQRLRVECSHVRRCGGCPRNGNQATTSPPMIHQTTRRPWSSSVTLTTRPTAAWPGTPHAIDLTLQLPRSLSLYPSFAFLLVMAFISPSLSPSRFVSISCSILALPSFNLLFSSFLDVSEIYLLCISCTHLFGFIFNNLCTCLSHMLYFMHYNSQQRIGKK